MLGALIPIFVLVLRVVEHDLIVFCSKDIIHSSALILRMEILTPESSIVIREPFTRSQQIAGLVSLFGVVLIARPTSLFPGSSGTAPSASGVDGSIITTNSTAMIRTDHTKEVTLGQRFSAIGMALVGVCGAAWCVLDLIVLFSLVPSR